MGFFGISLHKKVSGKKILEIPNLGWDPNPNYVKYSNFAQKIFWDWDPKFVKFRKVWVFKIFFWNPKKFLEKKKDKKKLFCLK